MKLFNSFQLAVMFAAWPFLVDWLASAEFRGAGPLWWASIVAYIILFSSVTRCIYSTIDRES